MRRVLILGVGGVAAFAVAGAIAIYVLTSPGPGSSASAPGGAPQGLDGSPPTLAPPPAQPPPPPPVRARPLTPADLARFAPADPGHPYDPEADAKENEKVRNTLQRGRRGKPPRSAEDREE